MAKPRVPPIADRLRRRLKLIAQIFRRGRASTNAMIYWRYSGVYGGLVFDIVDSWNTNALSAHQTEVNFNRMKQGEQA